MMKNFVFVLLSAIAVVCSSCTTFVSKGMIEDRMRNTKNPHNIPIYYSEKEVPYPYEAIAFFEWRKHSILTHRKKIGHKVLKKTNKFIKKGRLAEPDAILITDFIHATYIQFVDDNVSVDPMPKTNINRNPREPSSNSSEPQSYSSKFPDINSEGFPKIRLGGGGFLGFGNSGNDILALNARVNRRLPELGVDNLVASGELTAFLPNRGVTRLFFNLNAHYYLDLQKMGVTELELRPYILLGGGWNYNITRFGSLSLILINLGIGGEYRLTKEISAFVETSSQFYFNDSPGLTLGAGLSYWWK